MQTLKVVSYNIKGLNTPEKRKIVQKEVRRLGGEVVFLQETHIRVDRIPNLGSYHYPQIYNSCSSDSKSKGVTIMISRNMAWQEKSVEVDTEGRWIMVKGLCLGHLFTFVAVYAPNVY